jgi:hypothetical protein
MAVTPVAIFNPFQSFKKSGIYPAPVFMIAGSKLRSRKKGPDTFSWLGAAFGG